MRWQVGGYRGSAPKGLIKVPTSAGANMPYNHKACDKMRPQKDVSQHRQVEGSGIKPAIGRKPIQRAARRRANSLPPTNEMDRSES